jgi:hypothetical protein
MSIGDQAGEFCREQRLAIDEQTRTVARAQQDAMSAFRQLDSGGRAKQKRRRPVHFDTAWRILRRQYGETECRFSVGFADQRIGEVPARLVRQSFDDFDANGFRRQLRRLNVGALLSA